MKTIKRSGGFTLLEVMIALVIVSVGLMGLVQSSQQGANVASAWRTKSQALLVADQVMLQLYQRTDLGPGITTGDNQLGGQQYHWQAEVKTTDNPRILRIDLSVSLVRDQDYAEAQITGFKSS